MDDLNKSEMAQRWAEFVIERWIRKIQALKIGDTGELVKSLRAQVELDANGDPEKITFLYLNHLSYAQIAALTDLSEQAVKQRIYRIKQKLILLHKQKIRREGSQCGHLGADPGDLPPAP